MVSKRTPKQVFQDLIRDFTSTIRGAFVAAVSDVADNAVIGKMITAIQGGDVPGAFQAVGFTPAAMRPLTAAIETAYETGGMSIASSFPKGIGAQGKFRFDVRNSRAEAYLRDHSAKLVQDLTEEARVNVQAAVQAGMREGVNPRTTALDIVGRIDKATGHRTGGIIGLTEQQATWVQNTRMDLEGLSEHYFTRELRDKRFDSVVAKAIENGEALPADTIDKLVMRYKDNALKYRGEIVARNESLAALNQSQYETYQQAVESGTLDASAIEKIWDTAGDNRVRPDHVEMDGQRVGFKEPFTAPDGSLLLFPHDLSLGASAKETILCRCIVRYHVDFFRNIDV